MIGIITDSTCDIPKNLLEQYGIIVVPAVVIWGEEQYRDRVELKPTDFYQRLKTDPELPHSSMPSVQDFQSAFDTALQRGADALIVLTISSAMSGTYQLAKTMASTLTVPVEVVDSKGPTMSLGWQVLAAARAIEAGTDLKTVVATVSRVRERMVQIVGLDTMKFLKTGGRIGNAAKWAGTLLQVKPVISINHSTGLVEPVGLARTHLAVVDLLYRKFFDKIGNANNLRIAVLHGDALEEAQALAERIEAEYHPLELLINMTGPVLGLNTGPGALALCGYSEN